MRILRVRLRHFRGVEAAEVRFAPLGVTIVQGQNEAGKSSLAEAIGVLFEHLDSTTKREVKAVKPVHRDEGAEVEADVETGPYAFTYFKRFHKKAETWLRIDRPRPVNLTGREAHERAEAILRETIDIALWKALQIEQGSELAPMDLSGQTRLSAALDATAGSSQAGDREESLFEAVRGEYGRYFTEGGQERREIKAQDEELAEAQRRQGELESRLRALESDVQRSAQLRREIAQLDEDAQKLGESVAQHDEKLAELSRLEADVGTARARASEAQLRATTGAEAVSRRRQLVEELDARMTTHAELLAELDLSDPERAQAVRDLEAAEEAATLAKHAHDTAASLLTLRQRDRTFRHEELDFEQLVEREARVAQAQEDIVAAERVLAGPVVNDRTLEDLQTAHVEVEKARAGLQAGSPRVRVTARVDITPLLDGSALALRAGDVREVVVERALTLDVPDVAELRVSAGGSAEELREALESAQRTLAESLGAAGVNDVAAASLVRDARREAARTLEEKKRVVTENLRDLTHEKLRAKIADLRDRVGSYPTGRAAEVPLAADLAEAKRLEVAADSDAERARGERDDTSTRRDQARARSHALAVAHAESQARLEQAASAIREAKDKLGLARASESDQQLAAFQDEAEGSAREKQREFDRLSAELAAASPEEAKTLGANARKAADGARQRLSEAKNELGQVTGRLQVSGEEGLAESRDVAVASCSRLEADLSRTRARSGAAKLLHDTMVSARKEAHAGYVAPLREQIEKLGRLVFGPTLRVDLDDSLAIASRTLDGVTVPFESLSGGTREQLGLLARLACAIIVATDGGAPVILDDALGYTDAGRLESMGAALARAGESCQVIVLTCIPERYRHVGGAQVVRLG